MAVSTLDAEEKKRKRKKYEKKTINFRFWRLFSRQIDWMAFFLFRSVRNRPSEFNDSLTNFNLRWNAFA